MAKIEVFDKPMCCPTGVCGPDVDPTLPRFAADLDWLKRQGHEVVRSNLAQQPAAFADNEPVRTTLAAKGVDCLPLIVVDGKIVSSAVYPNREQLEELASATAESAPDMPSAGASPLQVVKPSQGCCGDSGCC